MTLLVGPLMLRRADPRPLAGPALTGCLLSARCPAGRQEEVVLHDLPVVLAPVSQGRYKNPPMDTRLNGRGTLGGRAGRSSRN